MISVDLPYDPSRITKVLHIVIGLAFASLIGVFASDLLSWHFLNLVESGSATDAELAVAAEFETQQSNSAFWTSMAVLLLWLIVLSVWTYRTSKNAAVLRPDAKRITPTMAYIWYFAPILNLLMPFKALGEVWNSSVRRDLPLDTPPPRPISIYWLSTALRIVLVKPVYEMGFKAETVAEFRHAIIAGFVVQTLSLISLAALWHLAKRISDSQISLRDGGLPTIAAPAI